MGKKLTYEFVYNYFKEQNCKLLETVYINTDTKMNYCCKCGNKSMIRFNNFKNGQRCIKCSGRENLTYEFVNNYFIKNKYILIETQYKNANTKMKYICNNGHEGSIKFSHFQNDIRCAKCSNVEKHIFKNVYNYFKEQNCELLETAYINCKTKMKYICNCGNHSEITFGNFKTGYRCSKSANNEVAIFEDVQKYFKEQNCKLLSTEYINSHIKMKYICSCGNESEITYGKFKSGQRCAKCGGTDKHTFEFVFNYFKEQNCELLETEYINNQTKMKYICNCKNESSIIFMHFQNGVRCNLCKNKTEKKLLKWLKEQNVNIEYQVKFNWCKNKKFLPFDFVLENYKLIIELDGPQHFIQISNWKSPEETQKVDKYKMECALENGYRIIRICQRIVLADKEYWENQLLEAINSKEKLIKIGSVYDQVKY